MQYAIHTTRAHSSAHLGRALTQAIRRVISRIRRAVDWFFEGLELAAPYLPYDWQPCYPPLF